MGRLGRYARVVGLAIAILVLQSCSAASVGSLAPRAQCFALELHWGGHFGNVTEISVFEDGAVSLSTNRQAPVVKRVSVDLRPLCSKLLSIPVEEHSTILVPPEQAIQPLAGLQYVVLRPHGQEPVAFSRVDPDLFELEDSAYAESLRELERLLMKHFPKAYCVDPHCRYSRVF